MNSIYLGYLLSILSAAAFASSSLSLKWAFGLGMSAWSFTFVTSIMSLAVLLLLARREPRSKNSTGLTRLGLYGLFGAAAGIAFSLALIHLTISLGTILLFTYPAFVAVGAWGILGQRPTLLHLVALLLTLIGAALTVDLSEAISGAVSPIGIAFALLAALSHGLYMVLGEQVAATLSAVRATALTRVMMLLGVLIIHPGVVREVAVLSGRGWLLCIVATAVSGVVPFLFLNKGIALIGANRVAIASVAELPCAIALGLLFEGERISLVQWGGAILIIAAVITSQLSPDQPQGSQSMNPVQAQPEPDAHV